MVFARSLHVFFLAVMSCFATASGQTESLEGQLNAAILFHFAGYVTWPDSAFTNREAPFVIGIYGEDPTGGEIQSMVDGKSVKGRKIKIVHLNSPVQLRDCHMVHMGTQTEKAMRQAIREVEELPVLTVGETQGFVAAGGAIRTVRIKDRFRFKIDLDVLEKAKLKASSQMLRLDKAVIMRSGKEVRKP